MLNYVSVKVVDIEQAASFYDVVLGIMGYTRLYENPGKALGYGDTWPEFWISHSSDASKSAEGSKQTTICILATSIKEVDTFYNTALEMGATAADSPGYRPNYGQEYYSTSVYDLDNNHIEVAYYDIL